MDEPQAIIIKSKRIVYLDYLRVFAAFAVICIHLLKYGSVEFHSVEWWTYTAYNSLIRWAVPVFVMISGVFFSGQQKNLTVEKTILKQHLKISNCLSFLDDRLQIVFLSSISFNKITFCGNTLFGRVSGSASLVHPDDGLFISYSSCFEKNNGVTENDAVFSAYIFGFYFYSSADTEDPFFSGRR